MASSGVWENIILSKTPTFDGVCKMLFFTILIFVGIIAKMLAYLPMCYVDGIWYIKVSMFIRVNNPSLNRNIGKYHLPHIWDEVLINNIELKLK